MPGQWSARKAQFMAAEYKKRGGGYNTEPDKKDESQNNLSKWSEEKWQTKEGSGTAKKDDGTEKRYLPKKAWEQMNEKEKVETDKKKQKESSKGRQFVSNTSKAKESRKRVSEANGDDENGDEAGKEEVEPESKRRRSSRQSAKADTPKQTDSQGTGPKGKAEEAKKTTNAGASKTHGSKHDSSDAPAPQASKDRLPPVGKVVTWKAMPGWVRGEVTEIVRKAKTVNGKSVKATNDDPRVVLKSHGPSGKIAVHKPEAIYFDD